MTRSIHPFPPSKRGALLLAHAVLAAGMSVGCGPQSDGTPEAGSSTTTLPGKQERLALDRQRLRASLSGMETLALHDSVVASVTGLLRNGEEGTWRRSGDWAFRTFELGYWSDWVARDPATGVMPATNFDRPDHPYRALVRYAQMLEAHGIDFLVVPIPLRTQVYPERLPGIDPPPADFAGIDLGHVLYLDKLAEVGVEVVDLLPVFAHARQGDPAIEDEFLYHAFDRHWTPRGVKLAAGEIARRIRAYPWYSEGSAKPGVDYEIRRDKTRWTPRSKPGMPESGDPIDIWLERVVIPGGDTAAHEPDRNSSILVLGDSFLKHFDADAGDVASQLYTELKQPLDTIALPGGGSVAVWQALARRENGLTGKRLVLWLTSIDQLADPRLTVLDLFED